MKPLYDPCAREGHMQPSLLPNFTIELGRPGAAFDVTLHPTPLAELLDAVGSAHRLYELLLITRPGDVLPLLWVRLQEVPQWVCRRLMHGAGDLPPAWHDGRIPFPEFDRCFSPYGIDLNEGEDDWIEFRNFSPELRAYVSDLFGRVRSAAAAVSVADDPLIAQIVNATCDYTHPYCFLERQDALGRGRQYSPNAPTHPPAFYDKLAGLLQDRRVSAVAYRAAGDYAVLRLMATEQARRRLTGGILSLSALVHQQVDPAAWAAEIAFYEEGIGPSDLFIDGGGLGPSRLSQIMSVPKYAARQFILTAEDHGPLEGYLRDCGDGYWVYTRS